MVRMVLQWRCITNIIISLIYIFTSKEKQLSIIDIFLFFVKVNPAEGISLCCVFNLFRVYWDNGFRSQKSNLVTRLTGNSSTGQTL